MVVIGNLLLNKTYAYVLFDSIMIHSFMTPTFTQELASN